MKYKTLHEAIVSVLRREAEPMTFEEIAIAIKKGDLWRRRVDNLHPQAFQIRLRTRVQKKYKHLFKQVDEKTIGLSR